jgi:hypothetical protein
MPEFAPASSANPNLLTEAELMAWLGYRRRLDLIEALRQQRIPYFTGKGGIVVTTLEAVNAGLLGVASARMEAPEPIEF